MDKISKLLDPIVKLIEDKSNVVYLEYPCYLNVGDLLIYHGAEVLLKENSINPRYRCNYEEYSLDKLRTKIDENTTIIFQGGGNFGDLYTGKQSMREDVVRNFPKNRIIIFPQTIHFENEFNMNKSIDLFKSHNDVHICCRDSMSEITFKRFTPYVYQFPDTAHKLIGQLDLSDRIESSLYFIRNDKEKMSKEYNSKYLNGKEKYIDWKDVLQPQDYFIQLLLSRLSSFNKHFQSDKLNVIIWRFWFWYSKKLINRCSRFFSKYDSIVTSRLHGHILTCLVGRRSKVIDNVYGKNSRYCRAWTSHLDNVEFESFDEISK
ncbi:polysaccharide pyruvyl transferase family protein [Vibrio alginolyticus]|uniref:polysaccharide pyruvyl transferase family protein n=2 Tax=Vibrionaceae TaxID=641 RepID=UPI00197EF4F9|nr:MULTISPECIES: polysaccharide pyruvyl transferase family protein [Vibrio]MBO0203749.1 polysaccharide pyruvyl transferase family protein [Vibrio alginolyticus]MBS9998175.1 polysaccharide pyruvyl transferase family protein [Vibrio alginolyticus]MDW1861704.1 polysaccharide pyruvyl transferase family protein [Vibrio sp. Vb1166]QSI80142.1 polysaccharide pyruvyl transferase family protein [Vibrio alginolyticus]URR28320.1 polysaccharide pyruvyl transferase family protein [Vibrio alginolyticus]